MDRPVDLTEFMESTFETLEKALQDHRPQLKPVEVGRVVYIGSGVMRATGLPGLRSEELVEMPGGQTGLVFDLSEREAGIILLSEAEGVSAGDEVRRTGRILDAPVGEELLGRVVDASGQALDGKGPITAGRRRPIEKPAPPIMDRAPVTTPLQTGIKSVDALIPIGRGQRELIVGDRQSGKTAIAVDAILNQKDQDVVCIYCAVGQRASATAKVIRDLREGEAMEYSIVVAATEDDPPGLQFTAPYAAAAMGEYFMEQGRDVLVVFDDLTRHARAYREVSLLLRRPPGREAYPGDIFYIHSRLLERSTHLRRELGGGSLTALPIVETEAQNISAYIPTNLISITDGQIYLSPKLFHKGVLPAVDVGKSVSRVGGKTQLPAFRQVAGDLRLSYSQFEELESFARFGTRMDEETQKSINRGRRVREVLKQPRYRTIPAAEQIAVLLAVNNGLFDDLAVEDVGPAQEKIREAFRDNLQGLVKKIHQGEELSDEDRGRLLEAAEEAVRPLLEPAAEEEEEPGNG